MAPTIAPRVSASALAAQVNAHGFVVVDEVAGRAQLEAHGSLDDWKAFANSWNDLPPDEHMADGGRYRRRRHAVFLSEGGRVRRLPDEPHFQSLRDNPLNGGVLRRFAPVAPAVGEGHTLPTAIRMLAAVADQVRRRTVRWRAEVHQFRIGASAEEAGKPTPEGMHRDGVDFVLIMLVGCRNASHGVTTIKGGADETLWRARLSQTFETVLLDDARVRHGVSPIVPIDVSAPALRDVLVVTVRHC